MSNAHCAQYCKYVKQTLRFMYSTCAVHYVCTVYCTMYIVNKHIAAFMITAPTQIHIHTLFNIIIIIGFFNILEMHTSVHVVFLSVIFVRTVPLTYQEMFITFS